LFQYNFIVMDVFFVDGSTLYLNGTKENLQQAFQVLDTYYRASRAKMNTTLWVFEIPRTWNFGKDKALKWSAPGNTVLNLSFSIGFNICPKKKKMQKNYSRYS
jgi:hypothetical protein